MGFCPALVLDAGQTGERARNNRFGEAGSDRTSWGRIFQSIKRQLRKRKPPFESAEKAVKPTLQRSMLRLPYAEFSLDFHLSLGMVYSVRSVRSARYALYVRLFRLDLSVRFVIWAAQHLLDAQEYDAMAKDLNGKTYRTISDVVKELRTSVKTINKLVQSGDLPAPEIIENGGAPFRHYNDAFVSAAKAHFKGKAESARAKTKAD